MSDDCNGASLLELLREAERQRDEYRKRLDLIRPMTDAEWAVLMREHEVVHEARRLCQSVGEINSTAALDRALKRYDEAVGASRG